MASATKLGMGETVFAVVVAVAVVVVDIVDAKKLSKKFQKFFPLTVNSLFGYLFSGHI